MEEIFRLKSECIQRLARADKLNVSLTSHANTVHLAHDPLILSSFGSNLAALISFFDFQRLSAYEAVLFDGGLTVTVPHYAAVDRILPKR
jgi:hypothetical protein